MVGLKISHSDLPETPRPLKEIPISQAQNIAERYGFDQVMIYARKVGEYGGEHMTTYGINKAHCNAAARIGYFLKNKIMGWNKEN